jgi:hypothetical protein
MNNLAKEIESFLLFGPGLSDEDDFGNETNGTDILKSLQRDIDDLIAVYSNQHTQCDEIDATFQELQERIAVLNSNLSNTEFINKYEQFCKTQYKIQLLLLVKAMKQLEHCSNVTDISSIILTITSKIPRFLPDRSNAKSMIVTIIQKKKEFLLKRFFSFFEEQFHDENKNSHLLSHAFDDNDNDSNEDSRKGNSWELFLRKSRDYLLPFTLLSLLPSILFNESKQSVLEKFKESLDIALTPLWGRFYYHLKISIESKSKNQILWTFYYSKSFIEMIFNLILQITINDQLNQLYELNYVEAAKILILEKSIKFLKAHIASIFVLELLPSTTSSSSSFPSVNVFSLPDISPSLSFQIQIIEEVLELNNWLFTYYYQNNFKDLNSPRSRNDDEAILNCGKLTEVIYDSKEVFHSWTMTERNFILNKLSVNCLNENTAFSIFSSSVPVFYVDDFAYHVENDIAYSNADALLKGNHQLQCYQSVYDCISLFLLLQSRYSSFPVHCQSILSEIILEPLLCFILGLLLYRIRSNKLLFQISINTFINEYPHNHDMKEFILFADSVHYLEACVIGVKEKENENELLSFSVMTKMVGNSGRCRKKWTILQNWMPKILISEEENKSGFNLSNMMKITFKLPDKFIHHNSYEYRKFYSSATSSHLMNSSEPDDNLIESVNLILELAKTLVAVLTNHYFE